MNPLSLFRPAVALALLVGCGVATRGDPGEGGGPDAGGSTRPERGDGGVAACGVIPGGITPMPDPAPGEPGSSSPTIALADGGPIVAASAGGDSIVRQWKDSAWVPLGGHIYLVGSGRSQGAPAVATSGGRVFLAWSESDPAAGPLAFAAEWNGASWVGLGNNGRNGQVSASRATEVDIEIDETGAPLVAWAAKVNDNWILQVARWNGSAWVNQGGVQDTYPGDSSAVNMGPDLVVGGGERYLLWHEDDANVTSSIHVRRWVGNNWVAFGGGALSGLPGATSAFHARGVVDSMGHLIVAWTEYVGPFSVFVWRYNGSSWDQLASSFGIYSGFTSSDVGDIAVDSQDRPIITFAEQTSYLSDYRSHVYRYEGGMFVPLAGVLPVHAPGGSSWGADIVVDECDRVYDVWEEVDDNDVSKIYATQVYEPVR